jgi:hypothetical protein
MLGWGLELLVAFGKVNFKFNVIQLKQVNTIMNCYSVIWCVVGIWGLTMIYTEEMSKFRKLTFNSNQLMRVIETMAWF